jgi:hypothetical protein
MVAYCPIPISGVPMPHAVAGVACGLFTRTKPDSQDIDQYQILSDINVRPIVIFTCIIACTYVLPVIKNNENHDKFV